VDRDQDEPTHAHNSERWLDVILEGIDAHAE
jgi:hypothetical protein